MTAKIIQINRKSTPDSSQKFSSEAADGIVEYLDDFTDRCNALTEKLKEDIEFMERIAAESEERK